MSFRLPVTIKTFTGGRAPLGAQLALDAKLYNPKWLLKGYLKDIADRYTNHPRLSKQSWLSKRLAKTHVAIAYYHDVPIGVVLKLPIACMAYTLPDFRRMGVGSQMVEQIPITTGTSCYQGIKGATSFWETMGFVRVDE